MAHRINGLMHVGLRCADIGTSRRLLSFTRFRTPANAGAQRPRHRTVLQLGELTLELYQLPAEGLTRPPAPMVSTTSLCGSPIWRPRNAGWRIWAIR